KLSIEAEEIGCILFPWVGMTFQHFYFFKNNIKKIKKASQANWYPYQGKIARR
ncbi:hypothetical protein DB41_KU00010, partial [Neochlamydia sp. TUME1]